MWESCNLSWKAGIMQLWGLESWKCHGSCSVFASDPVSMGQACNSPGLLGPLNPQIFLWFLVVLQAEDTPESSQFESQEVIMWKATAQLVAILKQHFQKCFNNGKTAVRCELSHNGPTLMEIITGNLKLHYLITTGFNLMIKISIMNWFLQYFSFDQ